MSNIRVKNADIRNAGKKRFIYGILNAVTDRMCRSSEQHTQM